MTGPDGSLDTVVARNSVVLGSNPRRVGYLSSRLCIYSVPNCSSVGYMFYGTVHYKESIILGLSLRVRHSPDFGLLSVAILS